MVVEEACQAVGTAQAILAVPATAAVTTAVTTAAPVTVILQCTTLGTSLILLITSLIGQVRG